MAIAYLVPVSIKTLPFPWLPNSDGVWSWKVWRVEQSDNVAYLAQRFLKQTPSFQMPRCMNKVWLYFFADCKTEAVGESMPWKQ